MSASQICSNCESPHSEEQQFCPRCGVVVGTDAEQADDGTLYYNSSHAPGRARLTMIRTLGLITTYNLGSRKHRVGRTKGEILFSDDKRISPFHAEFSYREDGLYVEDLGSLNGIYIARREKVLEDEPVYMLIGKQYFRVEPIKNVAMHSSDDGTLDFVSPLFDYKFRVVHILDGGREGASICTHSNHVVIGRTSGDFKVESDMYLSPRHVLIREEDRKIIIRDIESKNGTFFKINSPTRLHHGDYLQMGEEIIRVEINS